MDLISIFVQLLGAVLGAVVQSHFENNCNKSYDKMQMCKLYIKHTDNRVRQSNSIENSFNHANVNGNLTVNQKNENIKVTNHFHPVRKRKAYHDHGEIPKFVWISILVLALLAFYFFSSVIIYLKSFLYFDYWYIYVVVLLSALASKLYYSAIKQNTELYWKIGEFQATVLILICFTVLFSILSDLPPSVEELQNTLINTIHSFEDVKHIISSINIRIMDSICLFFRYFIILLPIYLFGLEIYYLKWKKTSVLNTTVKIIVFYVIVYFTLLILYQMNLMMNI